MLYLYLVSFQMQLHLHEFISKCVGFEPARDPTSFYVLAFPFTLWNCHLLAFVVLARLIQYFLFAYLSYMKEEKEEEEEEEEIVLEGESQASNSNRNMLR